MGASVHTNCTRHHFPFSSFALDYHPLCKGSVRSRRGMLFCIDAQSACFSFAPLNTRGISALLSLENGYVLREARFGKHRAFFLPRVVNGLRCPTTQKCMYSIPRAFGRLVIGALATMTLLFVRGGPEYAHEDGTPRL